MELSTKSSDAPRICSKTEMSLPFLSVSSRIQMLLLEVLSIASACQCAGPNSFSWDEWARYINQVIEADQGPLKEA